MTANGLAANGRAANWLAAVALAANGWAATGFAINGLAANEWAANGLATDGLAANGWAANEWAANGLAAIGLAAKRKVSEILHAASSASKAAPVKKRSNPGTVTVTKVSAAVASAAIEDDELMMECELATFVVIIQAFDDEVDRVIGECDKLFCQK